MQQDMVIKQLKLGLSNKRHPRIMAGQADFDRIRLLIKTDPYIAKWYEKLNQKARDIFEIPLINYDCPDGLRVPGCGQVHSRVELLAFMYKLNEDLRYAERAWKELEAAAAFPDWNHHRIFLSTSYALHGAALGYDWLFDYLSEEQRRIIREAIIEKGLKPGLAAYRGTTPEPSFNRSMWVHCNFNWNVVPNSGLICGALAIGDEDEYIAAEILSSGLKSLENMLPSFAPEGAWWEGLVYWNFTTRFYVSLMATLNTALGTDFGYSDVTGVAETGYFPVYLTGPGGGFNFSDCDPMRVVDSPELFWFARKVNDPCLATIRFNMLKQGQCEPNIKDLLWYDPDMVNAEITLALDRYYKGSAIETGVLRSSWDDPNGIFVAMHCGANNVTHADLDMGTFVLDVMGERWACDLGRDNYLLPDYFGKTVSAARWSYYRMRAEGNNTLVINPDKGLDQEINATARVEKFESQTGASCMVADITEAYKKSASSVKRGIAIIENRGKVVVQDEIKAETPMDIWWFMHTEAEIEIQKDGRTAVLKKNGKKLKISLASPVQAYMLSMKAEPLMVLPKFEGENDRTLVRKLAIHVENQKDVRLTVEMVPMEEGKEELQDVTKVTPLKEWMKA